MSSIEFVRVAPSGAWGSVLLRWSAVLGSAAVLAACTATGAPVVGADPSDPNAGVSPVRYRSTLGSYSSQRPVAPSDWRQQNERVAPRSDR